MHLIFKEKTVIDNLKNSDLIRSIDNALALYVFGYWSFNGTDENLTNLKIAFLFREFLNFIGWDLLEQLANYKIVDDFSHVNDEYSKVKLAENLPELIDDFLGVFLDRKSVV